MHQKELRCGMPTFFRYWELVLRLSILYGRNAVCEDRNTLVFLDGYSGSRDRVLPPLQGKTSLMNTARQAADSLDMLSHVRSSAVSSISPLEAKRPGSTDRTSLFRG